MNENRDPNPKLTQDKFDKSNNLKYVTEFPRIIMLLKGEEFSRKIKDKHRFLYKNVISNDECDYWKKLINKYHVTDNNQTYEPDYKNDQERLKNTSVSFALDQIHIKDLIEKYKTEKKKINEFNELKIANNKFNEIVLKMKKYTENCYKKKLRLHSCNIISGNNKFTIPCHIDGLFKLQYTDNNDKKFIVLPSQTPLIDGKIIHFFEKMNDNNLSSILNPVISRKLSDYEWIIPTDQVFPQPFGFTGGQNDLYHTISCILYLSSQGEDFEDGELLIGLDNILKPKKGNVAIFTGGPENVHKVLPVSSGKRTTFLFWFSELDGPYLRNRIFSKENSKI
tara:strand:- start:643 stop:1653 length:1011 start_codon:yes stop_codon:yes gene_type:complete